MESVIATRRNSAKELDHKLEQALEELRSSKDLVKKFLQEREDSEEEIKNFTKQNTDLKGNFDDLHTNYLNIVVQQDHLKNIVTAFDQYNNVHERALDRILELETDLMLTRKSISELEKCKLNRENQHTHSLYEELVECNSQPTQPTQPELNVNTTVIDLT